MPIAGSKRTKTVRVDLKSCPDGFVTLRKLNYGEVLHRRDLVANIEAKADASGNNLGSLVMKQANQAVQVFEFTKSIIDHNLEIETGEDSSRPANLQDPQDVLALDSDIAQEIEREIDKLNQPADTAPFGTTPDESSATNGESQSLESSSATSTASV